MKFVSLCLFNFKSHRSASGRVNILNEREDQDGLADVFPLYGNQM
jgi:hypothetical protein